jgi:hypothetical protein
MSVKLNIIMANVCKAVSLVGRCLSVYSHYRYRLMIVNCFFAFCSSFMENHRSRSPCLLIGRLLQTSGLVNGSSLQLCWYICTAAALLIVTACHVLLFFTRDESNGFPQGRVWVYGMDGSLICKKRKKNNFTWVRNRYSFGPVSERVNLSLY